MKVKKVIKKAIKRALCKIACAKENVRYNMAGFFYRMNHGEFDGDGDPIDSNKSFEIYFGLLVFRIICKNIYTIACLGVLGCAIALPFISQLQSFLHLNHFIKLIFENNWHAIAKLISVALFSLLCAAAYLAQVIVSTKNLNRSVNLEEEHKEACAKMDEQEYNAQRFEFAGHNLGKYENLKTCTCYDDIVKQYPTHNSHNHYSGEGILSNI
jgi:hypothetical protein